MSCTVCYEPTSNATKSVTLVCTDSLVGHDLCIGCFEGNFAHSNACPTCRVAYSTEELEDIRNTIKSTTSSRQVVYIRDSESPKVTPVRRVVDDDFNATFEQMIEEHTRRVEQMEQEHIRYANTLQVVHFIRTELVAGQQVSIPDLDIDGELLYTKLVRIINQWEYAKEMSSSKAERKRLQRRITSLMVFLDDVSFMS